jgi:serine/threonine protein kinase
MRCRFSPLPTQSTETADGLLVMDSESPIDSAEETARERLAEALGPKFEVRDLLGRGGFAEVYEVHDRQLHRRLAVKVLRPDLAWTQGMLQRFEKEARALASLSHPNILPIHFVGDRGGLVYYAMPYVEGNSLGDTLRNEGPLDPERAVAVIRPILQALGHAHEKGMIHRDLKPDNIILDEQSGRPLLVDFGIVKQAGDGPGTTLTGFVVGTPTYMSPEQALGQANVDHRSDIYAIGGVLFHLVTGAPPFDGETSQEVIGRHIGHPVPNPSAVNARVPVWLSEVIAMALAKRPEDRFQTANEMADALKVGQASGPQLPLVSRESLIRQIKDDDPTHIMAAAQADGVVTTPGETRAFGRRSSDQPAPRAPLLWAGIRWLFLALSVAAAAYYFITTSPQIVVRNNLMVPVEVKLDSSSLVAPGSVFSRVIRPDAKVFGGWTTVRPQIAGQELGVGFRGNIQIEGLTLTQAISRKVTYDIDSWTPGGDRYFAPLITNLTGDSVRVVVNPGGPEPGCLCWIGPGERQVIGYYVLDESIIRVSNRERFAIYRDLERKVDPVSGAVEIRIDSASFRVGR